MRKFVVTFALCFMLSGNVYSQETTKTCRNGLFTQEKFEFSPSWISAKRKERVYFYSDEGNCPNSANCRKKSYLVNRNDVITSKKLGKYTCVWFQPNRGEEKVGWILTEKLGIMFTRNETEADWIGDWEFRENSLSISKDQKTGELKIKGEAFWKGYGDNIHTGEIDSKGKIDENNVLTLTEDECTIKLSVVFNSLVVSDNLKCGGANFTFSGVYRPVFID